MSSSQGMFGGRRYAVLGAIVVVGLALGVLVALRHNDRGADAAKGSGGFDGPPPPVTRAPDGAAVVSWGAETAPMLEIFTDYQCPACKDAQKQTWPVLRRLASQGRVRLVYRPVQMYRRASQEPSTSNSRRAANAALCAPTNGWLTYHEALFDHQPAEDAPGFTPSGLIALAERAGIMSPSFPACVTGGAQNYRVDALSRYAFGTRRVDRLPAAFLNGRPLDRRTQLDADRLERAIHRAERR